MGSFSQDYGISHTGFPSNEIYIDSGPSLVPRLLCGGRGKRAWYTLFAHAPGSLGNLHTTPLHYNYGHLTTITVNFCLPAEGRTAWLYSLWDTYGLFWNQKQYCFDSNSLHCFVVVK